MGDALIIFLQLIVLMIILALGGEPLRILLSRRLSFLKELDVLQALILDVYLYGLILFVIAMLPLRIFSPTTAWIMLIVGTGLSVFIHRKKLGSVLRIVHEDSRINAISDHLSARRGAVLTVLVVSTIFLVVLFIQVAPLANFVFGSTHDTSLHALFVEVIVENRQIPETLMPYEPSGVVYPQAFHVIVAYASYIFGFSAPQAVFYVTPLFSAMSVLGVYFLGSKFSPKEIFGVNLAFVFAFLSPWPIYVTWGANPFIGGFPLFFVSLGLLLALWKSKNRKTIGELTFIGILLGYLGAIMISFYEMLVVSTILFLVFKILWEPRTARARLGNTFTVFAFSLLPISVMLYKVFAFYPLPNHNIGVYYDVLPTEVYTRLDMITTLKSYLGELNPDPLLRIGMQWLLLISFLGIFYLFLKRQEESLPVAKLVQAGIANFGAWIVLVLLSYQGGLWNSISWAHQTIILFAFLCLFFGVFNVWLYSIFRRIHSLKFIGWSLNVRPKILIVVLILMLSGIYTPFIYNRWVKDPQNLTGSYALFAITTQDDYKTMLWMKDFLPSNATILVNPYEPGLFIPTVSHHRIVFPFTANQRSYSYQKLVDLIKNEVLNSTTLMLVKNFNITHVYVGSGAIYWWDADHKWNPDIFLKSSSFQLTHKEGNVYLFEALY